MQVVFYLALLSITLLWITLWRFEMTAKHVAAQIRQLRRLMGEETDEAPLRRSAAPSLTHVGSVS
jgi:hypothetical protein